MKRSLVGDVVMPDLIADYRELRRQASLRLLQMHFESRVGHIGGNLSALDILLCLYHRILGPDDRFVLSKGHAAGSLYVTLWTLGRLTDDELCSFHRDATRLSGHPPFQGLPDVTFATGSLGHGLGLSAGLALSKQLNAAPGRVFCLMSDGEWNEGSNWESLAFACHRQLSNLTFIVDLNGLQGFGRTREVANLDPLLDKFRDFGCDTVEIDGHDASSIVQNLRRIPSGQPSAVVAKTRKGFGVSFMEDRMEWHYLPMSPEQYDAAKQEIERACARSSPNR